MPSSILIDTHVLVWAVEGGSIATAARTAIQTAEQTGGLCVSVVSAWELGVLTAKRRIALSMPLEDWWKETTLRNGLTILSLDADIAITSTRLPGSFHADPADRFLVATARHHDLPIITADKSILAYAKAGHVRAIKAR